MESPGVNYGEKEIFAPEGASLEGNGEFDKLLKKYTVVKKTIANYNRIAF